MKKRLAEAAAWAALVLGIPVWAGASQGANPLFGYTHLLPSPFTIPAGRLVYGSDVSFGVTDFLQIGTGLFRDFYDVYNANVKLSLVDTEIYAAALTFEWESVQYDVATIGTLTFTRSPRFNYYLPGLTQGFALGPSVAWFTGGQLRYSGSGDDPIASQTSGFIRGGLVESDLSWAYLGKSEKKRRAGMGNVLSAGVSYDLTYKLVGVGLTHHWPGFSVGLHYYPKAEHDKVLPILTGGGSYQF